MTKIKKGNLAKKKDFIHFLYSHHYELFLRMNIEAIEEVCKYYNPIPKNWLAMKNFLIFRHITKIKDVELIKFISRPQVNVERQQYWATLIKNYEKEDGQLTEFQEIIIKDLQSQVITMKNKRKQRKRGRR